MLERFFRIIGRKFKREYQDVKQNEINRLIKEGAILVDVRSPQEFKEGHLNGAISLPEYEIKNKAEKILKDKKAPIIVYCTTGQRSKKAQKKLEQKGYVNVFNLIDGFQNY